MAVEKQIPIHSEETDDLSSSHKINDFPQKRISELEAFIIALKTPILEVQCNDDEIFALTLQLAIDDYGVSQTELAKVIGTQKSTVGRWKSASCAPITYSRPAVISAICALLESSVHEKKSALKI